MCALAVLVSVVIYPLSLGKNIRKMLICHLKTEGFKKKSAILEAHFTLLDEGTFIGTNSVSRALSSISSLSAFVAVVHSIYPEP